MKMRALRTYLFGSAFVGTTALLFIVGSATAQGPGKPKPVGAMPTPKPVSTPAVTASTPKPSAPLTGNPIPKGAGVLNFETKIGSFKCLGSDAVPVQGMIDLKFSGTVLVSNLDPNSKMELSGTVHKEYETKDHAKQVFFGTGGLKVTGKLRALQFFGKNLTGKFLGVGIFRFFGEFDKNLDTGYYASDDNEKHPWGTGGMQVAVPNPSSVPQGGKVNVH